MAEKKPEFVLVRHGETAWSVSGQHTGRTDIPLTAEGRARAEKLAPVFAGRTFAKVFTSPLSRALDTCRVAGLAERAERRDDLMEWHYGAYEGMKTPEIRAARPGWSLWSDGVPNGESASDVGVRMDRVIAEARAAGGDVIAFAHGHVLRVLAARWLALPPSDGKLFTLGTGAICVLGYEREQQVIVRWNDTSYVDSLSTYRVRITGARPLSHTCAEMRIPAVEAFS
jgi:broad specificity phosphatase PhoE